MTGLLVKINLASAAQLGGIKRLLWLGSSDAMLPILLVDGWTAVRVAHDAEAAPRIAAVRAEIGQDPHFLQMIEGHYVRAVTVREIFLRFPGPYNLIWIDVPDMNRWLWETEHIQDSLPGTYVLPEDGHNRETIKRARDRGYKPEVVGERLVLTKV